MASKTRRAARIGLVTFLGIGCLAPAGLSAGAAGSAEELEAVLAHIRGAVGHEALRGHPGILCRGQGRFRGLPGEFRLLASPRGEFLVEIGGELPLAVGFDGKSAWLRDHSGLTRRLELEDADGWKLFAWVFSGHWLDAQRPLAIDMEDADAEDGSVELSLALPGTPMEMTLAVDAETWFPTVLTYDDDAGASVWSFGDYRPALGGRVAYAVTHEEAESVKESFRLRAVERAPSFLRNPYEAVGAAPQDVSFGDEDALLETKRTSTGHLLVHPRVDSKDVGWFILDTGAGAMVIDPAVADELDLAALGEVVAVGVAGKITTGFRRGARFELGPMTLEDPVYVAIDLSFLAPIFGVDVAGVVGYDLFARAIVEVETASGRVALHDPASYELDGGRWQALVLTGNLPCIRASFEGDREGLFKIDTGDAGTVAFHAPAVVALDLLAGRDVRSIQTGGVGGSARAQEGELAWFTLADHRFDRPRVHFSQTAFGAFADRYTLGNIGQDFLEPFRMVLDYGRNRIALVPLQADGD